MGKKGYRKYRPSTAKRDLARRKIANPTASPGDDYLLNIDPSNQEIVAMQDQTPDPNEIYDLGDIDNLD